MEQIIPGVNSPKDLVSHVPKDDDMKINQPLYDTETGNFLALKKQLISSASEEMQIKHILYYGYEEKSNKISYSYKKKEFQTAFQVGFPPNIKQQ